MVLQLFGRWISCEQAEDQYQWAERDILQW
jgi:hypothetical protein